MSRKKRQQDEPENPDRWVVSYADFITLLFALFTTLYAISHVDLGKLKQFTGSMRTAFKAAGPQSETVVIEGIRPVSMADIGLEQRLREELGKFAIMEGVVITRDARGVVVSLGDPLLFDAGAAELRAEARPVLRSLASLLQSTGRGIVIEGHTDNLPLAQSRYGSNLELSAVRAAAVFSLLREEVPAVVDRAIVSGYGEYRPAASNATPEGRTRNRRVDIIFVAQDHNAAGAR